MLQHPWLFFPFPASSFPSAIDPALPECTMAFRADLIDLLTGFCVRPQTIRTSNWFRIEFNGDLCMPFSF